MGEWERLGPSWWAYRRGDQERPYGYALRQRQDGPLDVVWNAIVLGWECGKDETIVEGVSLEEARAAVERHAQLERDRS